MNEEQVIYGILIANASRRMELIDFAASCVTNHWQNYMSSILHNEDSVYREVLKGKIKELYLENLDEFNEDNPFLDKEAVFDVGRVADMVLYDITRDAFKYERKLN